MQQKKKQNRGIVWLVVALVVVLFGGVMFVGAVSGWFDSKSVVLDPEYYGESEGFMELTAGEYDDLVGAKKSFVVFVDQGGCTTADRLREYMLRYMREKGILAYRIMFSEMKESSLHEAVKYYPSVVVVSKGRVMGYLRADVDEDAGAYNDYVVFVDWMKQYLN